MCWFCDSVKIFIENLKKDLDEVLIGDRDLFTESYIENKRKEYKGLKADRRWIKDQLDNCSFNFYDVDINLAALRRIDKKICEIESSKIFKYIKEELIMAKKYREKPCNEVKAVQWTGKNISEVRNFTIKNRNGVEEQRSYLSSSSYSDNMPKLFIMEPDKDVEVSRNDYIVKGTDGEFYVCERNVFEAVYEEVKESMAHKAIAEREFTKRYHDIANLYERLAKDGIECSMTVDDKNDICTIYCHGVELADNSERINKSFEDVLEVEENDQ